RTRAETGDEAAVDLELVEREAAEVRERRVAGTEVVDREPDAERLERAERLTGRVDVVEEHALGDLEAQGVRRERMPLEQRGDVVAEVGAEELAGRQVDRHAEGHPGDAGGRGAAAGTRPAA